MGDLWFEAMKCSEDYAIAVRDRETLFQVFRIRRSEQGDVYWNFLARPDFMSHASYHRSGATHHKRFGRRIFPIMWRQPLTAGFNGTETLLTSAISAGEARA